VRSRLRPGEELRAEVRRHKIVLAGPLALALLLFGGLVAALFVHRAYIAPVAGALFAGAAIWLFWRWLEWRADLWAVTTQRVIDESGVLTVRVVDSPLDTIHNVTCEQTLWGRLLGYGTLNIQTAAEHGSTTIPEVAGPEDLRETILDLQQRTKYGGAGRSGADGVPFAKGVPVGALDSDARECPHCAETIKARAKVCRFCGRPV
jgi:membrane protein YdbS with pleckstrin-like domain